ITPGYAPNLMSYLFGSILSVSGFDISLLLFLNIIIILFFLLFFKPIIFISFDEEYAKTHHMPVQLLNYVLISLVALTIVFNIRVVGIILVISLLTIPQTIANLYTKSFTRIIFLAIIIGLLGTICGLFASYSLNIPSGASIIFFLVILFLVLKGLKVLHVRINRRFKV
ncbi:MAG: metal ABC transporter permease, partial [Bacteroidales bacterium]|nr:metal ABC transporter permease [Bacteroidales bacterium]